MTRKTIEETYGVKITKSYVKGDVYYINGYSRPFRSLTELIMFLEGKR